MMSSAAQPPRLPDFGSIEYCSKVSKEDTDSESSEEEDREARRPWRHQAAINNHSVGALQQRISALEAEIQQSKDDGLPAAHAQRLIERYQSAKLAEATVQAAGPGQARHQLDAALSAARRELRVADILGRAGRLDRRSRRGRGVGLREGADDGEGSQSSSEEEEELVGFARAQAVSWECRGEGVQARGPSLMESVAQGREQSRQKMDTVMEE